MIAIDTNILVRLLARDDAEQAEAARALLQSLTPERPGFICREVAIEIVWVLERSYRFPREQIGEAVLELLTSNNLVFEAADDVARAIVQYGRGGPGFPDLMILAAAARSEALPLHTLDRRLSREEGAELVEAG